MKTWTSVSTDEYDPVFWRKELLPQQCPEARILSFGYDADFLSYQLTGKDVAVETTIDNHSTALMSSLAGLRARTQSVDTFLFPVSYF